MDGRVLPAAMIRRTYMRTPDTEIMSPTYNNKSKTQKGHFCFSETVFFLLTLLLQQTTPKTKLNSETFFRPKNPSTIQRTKNQ